MKINICIPNLILSLFILILLSSCNKEESELDVSDLGICLVLKDGEFIELELDENPEFKDGGNEAFTNQILQNISYPFEARDNGIEGSVQLEYEINTQGEVINIEVIQDPGGGLANESMQALESVSVGTSFTPGIIDNEPVHVQKILDIRFRLE